MSDGYEHDKLWADMTYEIETLRAIRAFAGRRGITGRAVAGALRDVQDNLSALYRQSLEIPVRREAAGD